jgi:hypothetical protein
VTTLSFELPMPLVAEKAKQGLQPALLDERGRAVAMQVLSVEQGVRARPLTYKDRGYTPSIWVKRDYAMDRYHVAAVTAVPALGYRTLGVAFVGRGAAGPTVTGRARAVKVDAARGVLENGQVSLRVRADGRVDLYDATTRTWFRGVHAFEDVGDAGDGWNHQFPTVDTVVQSTAAKSRKGVRVRLGHQGALSASLRVSLQLRVPAEPGDGVAADRDGVHAAGGQRASRLPDDGAEQGPLPSLAGDLPHEPRDGCVVRGQCLRHRAAPDHPARYAGLE